MNRWLANCRHGFAHAFGYYNIQSKLCSSQIRKRAYPVRSAPCSTHKVHGGEMVLPISCALPADASRSFLLQQ